MEVSIHACVSDAASDSVAFFEKMPNGVFHEDVNAFVNAALLEGSNQFQTGCIANVSQPWECVASKVSLIDQIVWCSVKHRTPSFEFSNAVWGFLGVELSHPPVSQPFASLHGVMEVNLPSISWVCVLQCCSTSTFCHDRVGLTQQRFCDDGCFGTASSSFDGSSKSGTASTNDNNVVFVFGVFFCHHLHLKLQRAPYRSAHRLQQPEPKGHLRTRTSMKSRTKIHESGSIR